MRRFAAGAGRVWQDVGLKIPTSVERMNRRCHLWPWISDGRGLGHDPGVDTETHGTFGACQVLRKDPDPYAIDCVLAYPDTWGERSVAQSGQ